MYYKVLLRTTKYYSSTTVYYKVLLQYYSSTTPYYKVLLQYYSVLQSTTPVLLCTTKYYSSTTKCYSSTTVYYKVLLCTTKYYSVLQSTTRVLLWKVIYNARSNRNLPPTSPNTAPATPKECHDWSASHMKRHLQCGEQQASPSNLTKHCACHAKWISWLIRITYATSFTMRGATGSTLQPHQILRLPRKMNVMIEPHHRWNVIYNARSNRQHPPTSPNTAPATQNDHPTSDRNLVKTGETSFPMRDRSDHDPTMIRERSENDPTMIRPWKRKTEPAAPPRLLFALARSRFYWKLQRFPLRLSF